MLVQNSIYLSEHGDLNTWHTMMNQWVVFEYERVSLSKKWTPDVTKEPFT